VELELFLIDLLETGEVILPNEIVDFSASPADHAVVLLKEYYHSDSLQMPYSTPEFHPKAAVWAAQYMYSALQLLLLRQAGPEEINRLLTDYEGEGTPEEVYSVDLIMRFLPDVFRLASGLSPEDPLVGKLKEAARCWPFSSIGIAHENIQVTRNILDHPSLRLTYIDRIIEKKDVHRLNGEEERKLLKEVIGKYYTKLWPDLNLILNEETI
jgi:hypothetical protein